MEDPDKRLFINPLVCEGCGDGFCLELETGADGYVSGYRLRMADPKRAAVRAFKGLGFRVIAAGDSYNDTAMLEEADAGMFFRPPASIAAQFPQFAVTQTYAELEAAIAEAI